MVCPSSSRTRDAGSCYRHIQTHHSTAVPTSVDEAAAAASRGQGALIHADSVAPAPIAKAGRVARGGAARKRKGALNELVCGPAMPRQPKIRCTLAGPKHEARRPTRSRWAHRNAQASVLNTDTCRVMDAHLSERGTTQSSEMPPPSPADGDSLSIARGMGKVHKDKVLIDEASIQPCARMDYSSCNASREHRPPLSPTAGQAGKQGRNGWTPPRHKAPRLCPPTRTRMGDVPVGRDILQQLQHHHVSMDVDEDQRKTLCADGERGEALFTQSLVPAHGSSAHAFPAPRRGHPGATDVPGESLGTPW